MGGGRLRFRCCANSTLRHAEAHQPRQRLTSVPPADASCFCDYCDQLGRVGRHRQQAEAHRSSWTHYGNLETSPARHCSTGNYARRASGGDHDLDWHSAVWLVSDKTLHIRRSKQIADRIYAIAYGGSRVWLTLSSRVIQLRLPDVSTAASSLDSYAP